MSSLPLITPGQVQSICGIEDETERNYQITQSYHDFSKAIAAALGDSLNANWSTFAAWASSTAGQSIRGEELPKWAHRLLAHDKKIQRHFGGLFDFVFRFTGFDLDLLDNIARTIKDVSAEVADGNLRVYAELGPVFASFLQALEGDNAVEQVADLLDGLASGAASEGGQELLKLALGNYIAAQATEDPKEKAEFMLLGNCRIGLHEQTRLQPNIKGAVDEPIAELMTEILAKPLPVRVGLALLGPFGLSRHKIYEYARREWEELVTRYAMNLALPQGKEISLGGPVTWPNPPPPVLKDLENEELVAVLGRFDDNLKKLRTHGADNWTDLNDRMGYIVELFRSQQQNQELFTAPPR